MGVSFDDRFPNRRLMTFDITGAGVPANLRTQQNLEDAFARRSSRQRRASTLYGSQEGYGQESIMSTTRAHRIQRQPHRNSDIELVLEPVLEPQSESHPSLLQHAASLSDRDICRMYGIYFGNTEELQSKTEILQRCRWVQQSLPDFIPFSTNATFQ